MFVAFLFDVGVWLMSSHISFQEESSQDELIKDGLANDSLGSDQSGDHLTDRLDDNDRRTRSNTNDTNNNSKDDRTGLLNESNQARKISSSGCKLEDGNNNNNLIEGCKIASIQTGESLPLSS